MDFLFFFFEHFFGHSANNARLVRHFFQRGGQGNHDFDVRLAAFLGHGYCGLEDSARLHFSDLRIGNAQPATTMSQHGIELVQVFHAAEQVGENLLQIAGSFGSELPIFFD